jgi:uncharacterized protein (TIGR00369 family)
MTRVDHQMPAEELMGVRVVDAAPGTASGVQAAGDTVTLSLGWFGVLADAMGGRPVAFSLPPGHGLSTVSMHLDLVRPPADADRYALAGEGRLLELGRSWGLSALTITGARSRVLAVGTVRFLVYPMADASEHFPANGSTTHTSGGTASEVGDASRPAAGDLITLLGMTVESAIDGQATLTLTPAAGHANPFPIVHGGLHTALIDAAITAALASLPGGPEMTLLSLDLTYHRPIPVDGVPVSVTATVLHRGRSSVLAEATISGPNGKALTTARGTFGLLTAPEA